MSSFSLKTVKHMKNGEAGFELLINNLEFMFYIHTRRPDPNKYRDIHTPLHVRLLFQEVGTYQKKLYIKTFPFPSLKSQLFYIV